jgi:hypothetical protein
MIQNALFLAVAVQLLHCFSTARDAGVPVASDPHDYGVDHSFPIHRYIKGKSVFKTRYDESMKGCYAAFSKSECDANERARMEMNLAQPATEHNYTEMGFKKTRVPPNVWTLIKKFYDDNRDAEHKENWPRGNTYTNNWESPTYMISFEDGVRIVDSEVRCVLLLALNRH